MPTTVGASAGPDFLCVGAQKAGTGWLYDQLQLHPDFWMPPIKELHYFDKPGSRAGKARLLLALAKADLAKLNRKRLQWRRFPLAGRDLAFLECLARLGPPVDLTAYLRLFEGKESAIAGDITPAYSILSEEVVADIVRGMPQARFVFIARDPVERVWSQITMASSRNRIGSVADESRLASVLRSPHFAERSRQTEIVERWRRHGGQRFRVFFFDDLIADAARFRRAVLGFLGGDPEKSSVVPPDFNRKSGVKKLPLSPATREMLAGHFADELMRSAAILGGPATAWPGKYRL